MSSTCAACATHPRAKCPPRNDAGPENGLRKGDTLYFSKCPSKALGRFLVKKPNNRQPFGERSSSPGAQRVGAAGAPCPIPTLRVPRQAGTAGRAPCPRRVPLVGAARRGGPGRHGLADGAGAPGAAGRHARLLQPLRPTERPLRGGSRRGSVRPGKPQRCPKLLCLGEQGDRGERPEGGCPSGCCPMGGGELSSWCGVSQYLPWRTPALLRFAVLGFLCFSSSFGLPFPHWDALAQPHHEPSFASTGFSSCSALPRTLPTPCPQIFYWTHLSYISVWTLLILHGPHFWKWFAVPGCLFVLEKVVGLAWRRAGGLRIVEVNLLPSKVCTRGGLRAPSHLPPAALLF